MVEQPLALKLLTKICLFSTRSRL